MENTRDCIHVLDPADGYRLIYVNAAACAHFGWDRETLQQMRIPDWDPDFDMACLPEMLERMKRGTQARIETVHRVASGSTVPVEATASYLEYEGRPLIAGSFRDISGRKARAFSRAERMQDWIELGLSSKVT